MATRVEPARTGQALTVLVVTVLLAYGAVWTRTLLGDDYCVGFDANTTGYWEAVRHWLNEVNGRLLSALLQTGMFRVPGFTQPEGPWWIYHGVIVLVHLTTVALLFLGLVRAGLAQGAALAGVLLFALHPVSSQAVLWLAAAYGYAPSALLLLAAVWCYLRYEQGGARPWLGLAAVLAVVAAAGIEQYIAALGALALVHLLRSRFDARVTHPWLPLAILALALAEFVTAHFLISHGTPDRLAGVAGEGRGLGYFAWLLAWWLNFLPQGSPYGLRFATGLGFLREHLLLAGAVVLAAGAVAWQVGRPAAWRRSGAGAGSGDGANRLWLALTGAALFVAPLVPFLFTGRYSMRPRNLYVPMVGLAVLGAAGLSWLAAALGARQGLVRLGRWSLAGVMAAFVGVSLVTNIGAQSLYARASDIHADVLFAIDRDRPAILVAGALAVDGIPSTPYDEITHMDTAWDFTCLAGWMLGADQVKAWTNRTPRGAVPRFDGVPHRIHWPQGAVRP